MEIPLVRYEKVWSMNPGRFGEMDELPELEEGFLSYDLLVRRGNGLKTEDGKSIFHSSVVARLAAREVVKYIRNVNGG